MSSMRKGLQIKLQETNCKRWQIAKSKRLSRLFERSSNRFLAVNGVCGVTAALCTLCEELHMGGRKDNFMNYVDTQVSFFEWS